MLVRKFGGDVFDAFLGMLFGGVVDEDVEMAKFFNCLFYQILADAFIADVPGDRYTAPALLFDRLFGFFGIIIFVEIADDHVSAFLGKGDRHCTPDTAVSARN
jgi:hypothetical protein